MSATATAAPWTAASQDGSSHLEVTLLDDTVVVTELRGMDPETAIGAYFREGFFRIRENGRTRYVASSQIKSIETEGGKER
jgi:hypothetical protein